LISFGKWNRELFAETLLNLQDSEFGLPRSLYLCQDKTEAAIAFTQYWSKDKLRNLTEIIKLPVRSINEGLTCLKPEACIFLKADLEKVLEKYEHQNQTGKHPLATDVNQGGKGIINQEKQALNNN